MFNTCTFEAAFLKARRPVDPAEISVLLPFGDREGYFAFREEWRSLYRELSAQIRFAKAEMRVPGGNPGYQSMREVKRGHARAMMAVRTAARLKAAELRASALELVAA